VIDSRIQAQLGRLNYLFKTIGLSRFFANFLAISPKRSYNSARLASAFYEFYYQMKYTCSSCGQVHDEWPALAFDSPTAYHVLSDSMKQQIGELTDDFCVIRHPEQTDRYIRCTLTLKVVDHCEDLDYGAWVSLSEKSFLDYTENFKNYNHEGRYFGWFSNDIPEYEILESIPTTVFTRPDGLRPEIVPFENFDHPLVYDYYHGISKAEAERRIQAMLKVVGERERDGEKSKSWWKLW
jgi:hypothetical protein